MELKILKRLIVVNQNCVIFFFFLIFSKIGSVMPIDQQIKLVSRNIFISKLIETKNNSK